MKHNPLPWAWGGGDNSFEFVAELKQCHGGYVNDHFCSYLVVLANGVVPEGERVLWIILLVNQHRSGVGRWVLLHAVCFKNTVRVQM